MNTAARALEYSRLPVWKITSWNVNLQSWGLLLLLSAMVWSGLAVIYISELQRGYCIEIERLDAQSQQLLAKRSQLIFEYNVQLAPARVQRLAEKYLDMVIPTPNNIVTLIIPLTQVPSSIP